MQGAPKISETVSGPQCYQFLSERFSAVSYAEEVDASSVFASCSIVCIRPTDVTDQVKMGPRSSDKGP